MPDRSSNPIVDVGGLPRSNEDPSVTFRRLRVVNDPGSSHSGRREPEGAVPGRLVRDLIQVRAIDVDGPDIGHVLVVAGSPYDQQLRAISLVWSRFVTARSGAVIAPHEPLPSTEGLRGLDRNLRSGCALDAQVSEHSSNRW
jgi:hypothetical protein